MKKGGLTMNVLEAVSLTTVADVFTQAGAVMTGFVKMGIDGITALFSSPIGIVIVLLPLGIAALNWLIRKAKRH